MKKKQKSTLYILAFIVLILILINVVRFYKFEYNNPIIKNKIVTFDINYLYDSYIGLNPNIQNRPYYGNQDAAINLIAYLDIDSEASRHFIEEILPRLKDDYIHTGKVKYYHKNYITIKDINEKNDNFRYAATLLCINKLKKEVYHDFYLGLFSISSIEQLPKLLKKYGIQVRDYNKCMAESEFNELYEDALEAENFGIVGLKQRFYIGITGNDNTIIDGVPNYTKFEETIREYEIQLGD